MKAAEHDVKGKGSANGKAVPRSAKGKGVADNKNAEYVASYDKGFREGKAAKYNTKETGWQDVTGNKAVEFAVEGKGSAAVFGKSTQRKEKSSPIAQPESVSGKRESVSIPLVSLYEIPGKLNDSAVLNFLSKKDINWAHINTIKVLTGINYEAISNWLHIDVKTLRKLKNPDYKFKPDDKEKVLLLMILFKHGISAFGTAEKFKQWLFSENFYFGKKQPCSFLNTGTGIRFVDASLTAIEYGDNA